METKEASRRPMRKLTVPIQGLACGGGGSLQLEKQIEKLPGVAKVYVNPATREAYVDVSDEFNLDEMLDLIRKNGFQYEEPRWN
ncbi:MAG: heavy metal-associated domain-containing protein [Nitrosomonas ureae]